MGDGNCWRGSRLTPLAEALHYRRSFRGLYAMSLTLPLSRPVRHVPARSAAVAPLLAVLAVLGVVFFTNLRDEGHATRIAAAEIQRHLHPGERVLGDIAVRQRHWYHVYRATYGVLAATDRRAIYVGVVPELYTTSDAPRMLDSETFRYDSTFAISRTGIAPARLPLSGRGVLVRSGGRALRVAVAHDGPELGNLVATASRRSLALVEARRREQAFRDSIAALPPLREYHRVERGEALEMIARRYGTTADVIRTLNQLLSDRIRVGQVLIVSETPRPTPPCPTIICGEDPERELIDGSTGG